MCKLGHPWVSSIARIRQTGVARSRNAQEDDVAGKTKKDRIDPSWPQVGAGEHPVSELVADKQGALSPFGDTTFPLNEDAVPYEHPVTVINK